MEKYISFDIGGTKIKYGIINSSGKILEKSQVDTPQNSQKEFFECIYRIIDKYEKEVSGIAMCIPGKIDTKNKIIYHGGALLYLDKVDLQKMIGDKYHLPLEIENDAKAAALCELWLGKMKNINSGAVITLGTGVGGGIVVNGNVLHGRDFQAGELSWMIINSAAGTENQEAYSSELCSSVKMIKHINKAIGISDLTDGKAAFEAINNGNLIANKIFKKFCMNVAIMILNIQVIINGEVIVVGGGISSQPILISEIIDQFDKLLKSNSMIGNQVTPPKIVAAAFKNDTNLYGALYTLLENNK